MILKSLEVIMVFHLIHTGQDTFYGIEISVLQILFITTIFTGMAHHICALTALYLKLNLSHLSLIIQASILTFLFIVYENLISNNLIMKN